jgi:penicillin-binding protein 2
MEDGRLLDDSLAINRPIEWAFICSYSLTDPQPIQQNREVLIYLGEGSPAREKICVQERRMKRFRLLLLGLFLLSALIGTAAQRRPTRSTSSTKKPKATRTAAKTTAVKPAPSKPKATASSRRSTATQSAASKKSSSKTRQVRAKAPTRRRRPVYSPWDTPSYADSTYGDVIDGEDLVVRRAAEKALGPLNGAVVVADPNTGRILAMINQKLALTGAYQPCSTIKLVAGIAGLNEGIIERETRLRLSRRETLNLTVALAKSNNLYFANVGEKLGFDRVNYYARLFGLGEKAGLNIEGESPGVFPDAKPKNVPVGMMTSFGETIGLTPLQLTALVSAIANGGTLYWLQYPRSQEEAQNLVPRVKRYLDIQAAIPDMKPGMMGAVDFGTARRANYDTNEPILGKTGTCTDARTHLGWFASFNEVNGNKLAVVVLLTGGKLVNGPVASGVGGQVYRNLSEQHYFAKDHTLTPTAAAVGGAGDTAR